MQTMSSESARARGSVFSEVVQYALKKQQLEMESITLKEEQLELISWQPLRARAVTNHHGVW